MMSNWPFPQEKASFDTSTLLHDSREINNCSLISRIYMALQKYVPSGDGPSLSMKSLSFSNKAIERAQPLDSQREDAKADVDVDVREIYFLIMHFLSAGPCQRTCGQFWNELLEHQLLPRRYHAWYSRGGEPSGNEDDDGMSLPLSYNKLVER